MTTPLDPRIARAIVARLKPSLAKAGYKRKQQLWYSFSAELIKVFELEPGYSKPIAYFNLGVSLRSKKMGRVLPRASGCLVHVRLDELINDFQTLREFGKLQPYAQTRSEIILNAVETTALPFLSSIQTVSDLQQAYFSGRLRGWMMSQSARSFLSHFSA